MLSFLSLTGCGLWLICMYMYVHECQYWSRWQLKSLVLLPISLNVANLRTLHHKSASLFVCELYKRVHGGDEFVINFYVIRTMRPRDGYEWCTYIDAINQYLMLYKEWCHLACTLYTSFMYTHSEWDVTQNALLACAYWLNSQMACNILWP